MAILCREKVSYTYEFLNVYMLQQQKPFSDHHNSTESSKGIYPTDFKSMKSKYEIHFRKISQNF